MKHERSVNGAQFSPNQELILTWSGDIFGGEGSARLWDIRADYDFPKKDLVLWIEVMTGTTMDNIGYIHVLSRDDWQKKETNSSLNQSSI